MARVMWEADEEWRNKLRSVCLSDLVQTLSEDIPAELFQKSFEWILGRQSNRAIRRVPFEASFRFCCDDALILRTQHEGHEVVLQ